MAEPPLHLINFVIGFTFLFPLAVILWVIMWQFIKGVFLND